MLKSNLTPLNLYSGIGKKYWHVLAGRAISGVGGAGMTALVSVIIAGKKQDTELCPHAFHL